ncbi:MAG: Gldg family protein [Clostridia bacterium]|nr:Gldg family protein [Clostridia bacterium]
MNQNENKKTSGATGLLGLNRATRVGSWTVAMTLIVLAVLVVINLLVGALPTSVTKLDTTSTKLFTISATTEKYVKGIDRDVNMLAVLSGGTMTPTLEAFLERYTALNSHIRIKTVDPVADPTFLEKYSEITTSGNYIIVESDLRYTVVSVDSLNYVYLADLDTSIDTATYQELINNTTYVQYYAQYGVDLNNATYYFGGEQAITSAIEYVVTEDMPHIYVLSGNGEGALSTTMTDMFDMVLMEYEELHLGEGNAVPEDASCVIINAPQHDLTTAATAALANYIEQGGNVILTTAPANTEMPNLMSLMADLGATPTTGGMLYEGNANKYVSSPYVLNATVNTQHDITYTVYSSGYSMIMPRAHGILLEETLPDGMTATTLFSATDAYTVAADGSETDWGAVATGVILDNANTGSKVVWFASLDAFSDSAVSTYGMGATYYFTIATNLLNDGYASTLTAIEALDVTEQPLTVSAGATLWLGGILIAVLPFGLILGGLIVWIRRRRR